MSVLLLSILLGLTGCGHKPSATTATVDSSFDSAAIVAPVYAKGFNVTYAPEAILLDLHDPLDQEKGEYHFALVGSSHSGEIPNDYIRIDIPIKRAVCTTSLPLSYFLKLGLADRVVGISTISHLYDEQMQRQLLDGTTSKIGPVGNADHELIIALSPEVVFISPSQPGDYGPLISLNIPIFPHYGYEEISPLGQAEWIKVIGLLTGTAAEANEQFDRIASRYNELKAMAGNVAHRPKVFEGELWAGSWFAYGGQSFFARLIDDAGGDYFMKDNPESGGLNLDFETVYARAADADYWRILNGYDGTFDYAALRNQDRRYTDFKAWKNRGIIYCNLKEGPYYESIPVEPEQLLADFLHVFHPELLPDHEPVYYRLLK